MSTPTTNYGFPKPIVGGDSGSWGTELNTALDDIDARIKDRENDIATKLPTAGGALTGRLDAVNGTVAVEALGTVAGAATIDCSKQYITATANGAVTWAFSNVPSTPNSAYGIMLRLTNGGSGAQTWPAAVRWPGGTAPLLSAAGTDLITMITDDQGTTWRAYLVAKGF